MSLASHIFPLKIIAISLLISSSFPVSAQTTTSTIGKFTHLKKGESAPFDGTLFDPLAVAKILAERQRLIKECSLEKEHQKNLSNLKCKRDKELLEAELQIEKKKYNLVVEAQKEEIATLRELATGENNTWWVAIGFALGSLTSVAIFFAAVQVSQ